MENIDGEFFISIQTFSENHIFQLKKKAKHFNQNSGCTLKNKTFSCILLFFMGKTLKIFNKLLKKMKIRNHFFSLF